MAVIVAYIMRPRLAGTFAASHMTYAIMTFWVSLLPALGVLCAIAVALFWRSDYVLSALGTFVWWALTTPAFWLLLLTGLLWYIYRCVRGLILATGERAISNPRGLL